MKQSLYLLTIFILSHPISGQEAEDIRDVKGLVEIPKPPNYLLWAVIALLVIAAAIGIWKWLTRKPKDPGVSAAKVALAEIGEAEALIPDTDPEPFVLKVTDAIRNYIEGRFGLAAPRRTTEEFLREIHTNKAPEISNFRDELGDFLKCCDAVKFGQAELATEDRQQLITSARNFIENSQRNDSLPTDQ